MRRIDLAAEIGLSASGVTRVLNPMEKMGLITKEEGARDARVSLVRLTSAGETLLQDAAKSFNERAKSLIAGLTDHQRAAVKEFTQTFQH